MVADSPSVVPRRAVLRAAGGAGAVAGIAGVARAQGETHTVDMTDNLTFEPETITISTGDTVVWDNVGSIGHSVTAYEDRIPGDADYFASGGFDSEQAAVDAYPQRGDIPGGETYEYTFDVPGTYEYYCIPHETAGMIGTVEVSGDGAASPPDQGTPRPIGSGESTLPANPFTLPVVLVATAVAAVITAYQVGWRERDDRRRAD